MKILKEGTLKEEAYIGTCKACGCEFEFGPSDGKHVSGPREDDSGYEVKCPQCKERVFVYV